MNTNLLTRLELMVKKINNDEFDQELISSLLICLRTRLPNNTLAREVADFIAHPELKDRGQVYDQVNKILQFALSKYNKKMNRLSEQVTIEEPFHLNAVTSKLEETLISISNILSISHSKTTFEHIQACILLLLHGSRIKVENFPAIESIELRIAANPTGYLCLMAAMPESFNLEPSLGKSQYVSMHRFEIMTSSLVFVPDIRDMKCGYGYFKGTLHAKIGVNGKRHYALVVPMDYQPAY